MINAQEPATAQCQSSCQCENWLLALGVGYDVQGAHEIISKGLWQCRYASESRRCLLDRQDFLVGPSTLDQCTQARLVLQALFLQSKLERPYMWLWYSDWCSGSPSVHGYWRDVLVFLAPTFETTTAFSLSDLMLRSFLWSKPLVNLLLQSFVSSCRLSVHNPVVSSFLALLHSLRT